jgi:hypothetical protein
MNCFYLRGTQFYSLIIAFFSLLFFPSFFYVVLSGTSTALGLLVALFVIFFVTVSRLQFCYRLLLNILLIFMLVCFVLSVYSVFIFGFGDYSIDTRGVYSSFLLVAVILSACFFSRYMYGFSDVVFTKSILIVVILAVFIGLYSILLDQNFLGYERYAKSVFPFAEPSHYAITMGPFLFASGFLLSSKCRVILILFSLFFSISTPSLVMILFSILMILFFFRWSAIQVFFVVLSFSMLFLFLFFSEQGLYFVDRLSFSDSSNNLTALVYMQGWDDMFIALQDSNWLGIGFQNLGILSPGHYGDLIYSLAGEYKNRNDGGFLASKIIAEFGILGIFFVCVYLFCLVRSSLFLIKIVGREGVSRGGEFFVFSNAIIVAFFIELFARGYGYFSPGFFLVLSSCFTLFFFGENVEKRSL